ncbi:MAG: hypothetical protein O3B42_02920 [Actinomycetota bacterium]|nr:hypothetical protein [Actinomycetota bacterium]
METMTLVHTSTNSGDLTERSDADIEAWFSQLGLEVEVVAHCDTASCQDCFAGHTGHKQAA